MLRYKVVETSTVTDDVLEKLLNEWTGKGWFFDGVHFVVSPSSSRPRMAFLTFISDRRGEGSAVGETSAAALPRRGAKKR